jgi:hypothetical protein
MRKGGIVKTNHLKIGLSITEYFLFIGTFAIIAVGISYIMLSTIVSVYFITTELQVELCFHYELLVA